MILSKCINPNQYKEVNLESTGLVIGQIQSGKTLSMTSVAAMAKDNGFGIVIVMSGAVTPLSFQTAERISSELKGRRMYRIINNPKDPWRSEQYASIVRNFSENFRDPSFPEDRKKTLLIITHKNPARIKMLTTLFENEKKVTAIYFKEEMTEMETFLEKVENIDKPIALYLFSWGNRSEFEALFDHLEHITIKTIPQPILEIYKRISIRQYLFIMIKPTKPQNLSSYVERKAP